MCRFRPRQQALDEDLQKFPYINGDLFKDRLAIPAFNASMRALLIDARIQLGCDFSRHFWFSSSPHEQPPTQAAGAHYTTEANILAKVIEPLFLDSLRTELKATARPKG